MFKENQAHNSSVLGDTDLLFSRIFVNCLVGIFVDLRLGDGCHHVGKSV